MMNLLSRPIVCLLIILLLGFIVYSAAINGEYLYDDQVEVKENPNVHQVFPLSNSMFGKHNLPVRPIPYLTFAINYQLGNGETTGFHLVNILIHVMNACLLWSIIIETLTLRDIAERYQRSVLQLAYFITIIWLVHPLVSMPVNYIYQRMEAMFSLFLLLTLYSSLRFFKSQEDETTLLSVMSSSKKMKEEQVYLQKRQAGFPWMITALLSCVVGMFCKEVMVVTPLLVLWYDRVFFANSFLEILGKRVYFYLGLFCSLILLFSLIYWQSDQYAEHKISTMPTPWIYLLTQTKVLCWYLRLTFWPDTLCFEYDWPFAKGLDEVWVYALIILALLAVTLNLMFRYPRVGFIAGLFFLILAPTSSFKPVLAPIFEHRMYLPVLSPIVLCVILVVEMIHHFKLEKSPSMKKLLALICLFMISSLGYTTYLRGHHYRTMISIWEDTITKAPNSFRPYFQLCERYFIIGEYEKCRDYALLSIEKEANNPKSYHNLGLAYYKLNEPQKGWQALLKAQELDPHVDVTLLALGNHSLTDGKPEQGYNYYKQAIDANPNLAEAHHGLAVAMMLLKGDINTIYKHFEIAISLKPDLGLAHSHLALFLDSIGKTEMALEHARIAVELLPNDEDSRHNFRVLLNKFQNMK